MDSLIPVINKLQDIFNLVGHDPLDLPQIVVVGSQSSGKSSVLESIVQRDFLPRGKDIVTRRPLVLQLIQTSSSTNYAGSILNEQLDESSIENHRGNLTGSASFPTIQLASTNGKLQQPVCRVSKSLNASPDASASDASSVGGLEEDGDADVCAEEWGEFLHIPERKFYSFDEIRKEIESDTAKVAGSNKGIAKLPIHLKIYSPRLLNLTLVDLPGITKIPVGDQPHDIEEQIKHLVYDYISKPNSIILAVTPANVDLVNSEALLAAREVDPEGIRTVGVLTKLDLMDAGTNALDILCNRSECRLRLGFIGLVNRSQQDIFNNKPIREALKHEADFFRNNSSYRPIADKCGSLYLARTLNAILMQHIKDHLPELRLRLNQLTQGKQAELAAYGEWNLGSQVEKGVALLKFLTKFATDFAECIDGTSRNAQIAELFGGARINFIFNEVFVNAVNGPETGTLSLNEVRSAIRNCTGTRPSLFVPEVSFDLLVRKQIAQIELPGIRCVELVLEELLKIVGKCDRKEMRRFPALNRQICAVSSELIRERLAPAMQMVQNLIQIEMAYINTNHPDFMSAGTAVSALERAFERKRSAKAGTFQQSSATGQPGNSEEVSSQETRSKAASLKAPPTGSVPESGIFSYLFRGTGSVAGTTPALSPHGSVNGGQPLSTPSSATTGRYKNTHYFSPIRSMAPKLDMLDDQEDALLASMNQFEAFSEDGHAGDQAQTDGQDSMHSRFYNEKEEMEVHLIYALVQSYCTIVRKNLQDSVPKSVMHFMVNNVRENLQNRLVTSLYRENLMDELLCEDEAVVVERKACKTTLEVYKRASNVLAQIKEMCAGVLSNSSSANMHSNKK